MPPSSIAAPPSPDRSPSRYRSLSHTPALDGLRAVAIVAVMLFHFPTREVVVGGLFGVDLFFALSGFLVTALLLSQFGVQGRVALGGFLARRGWRLLPALGTFLLVYLAADAVFGQTSWFASNPFGSAHGHPVSLKLAAKGVLAAATYTLNVMRAHNDALPNITHLWSLSIEGQFYVTWPLLMVVLLRWAPRLLLPVTIALAAVTASLPWFLWHGGAGANAIYFGSASRMQGLLIGSVGAQVWSRGWVGRVPLALRQFAAGAAGVTIVWLFLEVGNEPFKYLGAIAVASVAGIVLVLHFSEPGPVGTWGRVLGSGPMVWLGERSYAVYLWHYLFDCWTNPLPHDIGVPLGMAASLIVAELSWRVVEQPAQRLSRRRRERRAPRESRRPPALAGAGG